VSLRTLGSVFLALQQVQDEDAPVRGAISIIDLIADASPVSKAALLVLLAFSVVSWGIILSKAVALSRAERQTRSFLDVFRKSAKF
jgi:hypothetical protein